MTGADRGASAVEYALLVAMIALAIVAGLLAFGPQVAALFDVDFTP
ncbi:Flp pilus assembly pilin Flp [Nocardioides aromaticivorans]|nr:Flp family type IVb pilin [Nocardioides aromaticivorans]NYI46881.1 Flp pilus assembly pilin Flp [Nocardioides aromaticivorans]